MVPQTELITGIPPTRCLDLPVSVVFRGKINWSKLLRHGAKFASSPIPAPDHDLLLVERCDDGNGNDNSISSNPDKPIKGEVIAFSISYAWRAKTSSGLLKYSRGRRILSSNCETDVDCGCRQGPIAIDDVHNAVQIEAVFTGSGRQSAINAAVACKAAHNVRGKHTCTAGEKLALATHGNRRMHWRCRLLAR